MGMKDDRAVIDFELNYVDNGSVDKALDDIRKKANDVTKILEKRKDNGKPLFSKTQLEPFENMRETINQSFKEINDLRRSISTKPITLDVETKKSEARIANLKNDLKEATVAASNANLELGRMKKRLESAIKSGQPSGITRELSFGVQHYATYTQPDAWKRVEDIKKALAEEEEAYRHLTTTKIDEMDKQRRADNWNKGKDIQDRVRNLQEEIDEWLKLAGEMDKTANSSKKVSSGNKSVEKSSKNSNAQIYYLLRSLKMLGEQFERIEGNLKKFKTSFLKLSSAIGKGLKALTLGLFSLKSANKKTGESNQSFAQKLGIGFKQILKYTIGIRSLYVLMNKLRSALSDGMKALASSSSYVNAQMSSIISNLAWMKNATATAVQPLLKVLAPAIEKIAVLFNQAAFAIASFFATLTGQAFVFKAIKPMEDYAGATDKANKKTKELKKELMGFDQLNVITTDRDSGSGKGGSNLGNFETTEIAAAYSELAEKVKSVVSTLFDPIKKAWDTKGKFVMDSWKLALQNVSSLLKTIGSDFLKVWANDTGVKIWENIFHIIGDVGLVVANLASNFENAWKKNDVGYKILLGIQNIIYIISEGLKACADATVEWSKNLDFYPLLSAIKTLIDNITPAIQTIVDLFTYFWINVLLPFQKYMIEKGLPLLLKTLGDIVTAIDWEKLSANVKKFMDAFEPFLEKFWQALMIVLKDIGTALAGFVNSEGFQNFVDKLIEWMKDAKPEDMAKQIEKLAKDIAILWVTIKVFSGITKIAVNILTVTNAFKNLAPVIKNVANVWKKFSGFVSSNIQTIAGIGLVIMGVVLAIRNFIDMWKNGVTPVKAAVEVIAGAIVGLGLVILGVVSWPAIIVGAVVGAIIAGVALIHEHWDEIVKFAGELKDKVVKTFSKMKEGISNKVESIKKDVSDKFNNLKKSSLDKFNELKEEVHQKLNELKQNATSKAGELKDAIKEKFEDMKTKSVEKFNDLKSNAVEKFKEMHSDVVTKASSLNTDVKEKFDDMKNKAYTAVSTMKSNVQTKFQDMKTDVTEKAKGLRDNVKEKFKDMKDNSVEKAKDIKDKVKEKFQELLDKGPKPIEDLKDRISRAFSGMWTNIKGSINSILAGVEKMANGVVRGFNKMISALNGLKFNVPYWVPLIGGQKFGFNIPSLSGISIPRLAQGAVIPPNQEFLAVLGDQKRGTNIEAPLDTIVDAFNKAGGKTSEEELILLREQNRLLSQLLAKDVTISSRDIFNSTRSEAQDFFDRNGISPYPI